MISANTVIVVFYLSIQPYYSSYLLVVQNQSVTAAGHIAHTFSFTSTVTGVVVSIIIKYTGRYKYLIMLGGSIFVMGVGLMIRYTTMSSGVGQMIGAQIAMGIGVGMLNVPAQLAVQATAGSEQVSTATAAFLMAVEMGGATGSAISGAIWNRLIPAKLERYLPDAVKARIDDIDGSIETARSYMVGTPERDAIDRAYQETMETLLTVAICSCIPVVLAGLLIKDYRLDTMEKPIVRRDVHEKDESNLQRNCKNWKIRNWFNVTAQVEL